MKEVPPSNVVWKLLEDAKKNRLPGEQVKCSLFGRVNAVRANNLTRELIGEIPDWLQRDAISHGFKVIGADFRDDKYTFEILPTRRRW